MSISLSYAQVSVGGFSAAVASFSISGPRYIYSDRPLTNCAPKDVFDQNVSYEWLDRNTDTTIRIIPEHPLNAPSMIGVYIGSMRSVEEKDHDDIMLDLAARVSAGATGKAALMAFKGRGQGHLVGVVDAPKGPLAKPTAHIYDIISDSPRHGYGTMLLSLWRRVLRSWDITQWRFEGLTRDGTDWMYELERRGVFKVLYYYPPEEKAKAGAQALGLLPQPSALVEDTSSPDEYMVQGKKTRVPRLRWLGMDLVE